jgi:hypothetical protein
VPETAGGFDAAPVSAPARLPSAHLPSAVGDAVVAATPLRHGLGNAATGGIWRVRGTAGSAILKVARLMDMALLPEIAESATDGYLVGLRDGGWTGSADAVRTTIAACGAAKYSWFAPAIAGRAARDHIGPASYGQDTSAAEAAHRVTALVTLIADWAEAGHGAGRSRT